MMKLIKILIVLLLILGISAIDVQASSEYETITKTDGTTLTYKNTNIEVNFPKLENYESNDTEFRGAWVSAYAGDISGYTSTKEACQEELTNVLDIMEQYNLNTILFHIRTHNDAFYDTNLAPKSNYIKACDFDKWDYLEWFINECHKRGIEFHAWMNPYRISSTKTTMQEIKNKYSGYSQNPARIEENVLIGSSGAILDPGSPTVRNYLVKVCMEVIEKYDVDAIHFDDYFYIEGIDDSSTFDKYKDNFNTSNIEEFRRLQVDAFIEQLSNKIYEYNQKNNKAIQLGISPSGVYRNGSYSTNYVYDENGTLTSPVASNSTGYSHYDKPLYSDTKKWIDNEWIDYIIPQLYGSLENTGMPYADMIDWWIHVVKYKKVNLYAGIGIYQMNGTSDKGWYTTSNNTFTKELLYNSKYEEVRGACLYSLKTLKSSGYISEDIKYVKNNMWNNIAINPISQRYDYDTKEFSAKLYTSDNSNTIVIEGENNRYLIYKDNKLIGSTSLNKDFNVSSFVDATDDHNVTYEIVPMSYSNKKGESITISTPEKENIDIGVLLTPSTTSIVSSNATISLNLSSCNLLLGNSCTYKLYSSSDGINFNEIDKTIVMNTYRGATYSFTFNDELKPIYFKLEATNEYGTVTSEVVKIDFNRIKASAFFDGQINVYNKFMDDILMMEE